jgi:cytochrome c peroxidase
MTIAILLASCAEPEPPAAPGSWTPAEVARLASMRLDVTPRPDPSNAWADDPEAALGTTRRHVPGIVGNQWGAWFFWDGRADSLWAQALGPIENRDEMGGDRTYLARYVVAIEGDAYRHVFGDVPDLSDTTRFPARARPGYDAPDLDAAWKAMAPGDRDTVNRVATNAAKAIAAYERRVVPEPSPFDRYVDALMAGDASGGGRLDEAEIRGLGLFLRHGCTNCHAGPMFTDRSFHNLGMAERFAGYDPGREEGAALVRGAEFDCDSPYSDAEDCPELRYLNPDFPDFQAAFKTPSLRYVAQTAPYMHNGSFADLEEVVRFYSTLPDLPPAGHRELTLKPLNLSEAEVADLVAFLGTLTGDPLPPDVIGLPIQ